MNMNLSLLQMMSGVSGGISSQSIPGVKFPTLSSGENAASRVCNWGKCLEAIIQSEFKDGTILEIRSKTGTYNNVTLDMSFAKNVNMFYMDSSLFSEKADFSNANNRLTVEGNIKTQSPEGNLAADKLNFDFTDKKLKVSMYNEDKVNIKTKF